jgi:RHS repeat-associated protein
MKPTLLKINYQTLRVLAFSLLSVFAPIQSFSQGLSGPESAYVNESHDYVFSDDFIIANPIWQVTNGSVTNYWQSGINYYVTVQWTTVGTGSVEFYDGGYLLGQLSVSVSNLALPPDPPVANAAIQINPTWFTANWTYVSGATSYRLDVASNSSFSPEAILTNYNNLQVSGNNQQVTGLAMATTYYYRVRAVNDVGTSANSNTISVTTQCLQPTPADAGPDQTGSSTCGLTTVTLTGNTPTIGSGAWSIVSGSGGSFGNPSSPNSTFSGTAGSTYTLRWTTSTSCTSSTDDVVITFNRNPTVANAGPDQNGAATCGLTTVTLAANTPSVGTGSWSIVSGSGGSFANASSPTSTFSGTAGATYTLRWTIANSPCTASTDDVVITFNQNPTPSNAGNNQTICSTGFAQLSANTPSAGTGSWSVSSGPSTSLSQFSSISNPSATFTPFGGPGTYVLVWMITNSPCGSSASSVTITVTSPPTTANAGPDQEASCGSTTVTLAANTPAVGTGGWSIVSGSGGSLGNASNPASTFSGIGGVTYVLRWTISNGSCTSFDDVLITFTENPTSPNGPIGPTDVEVGDTHTYTFTDDVVYTANWTVTNAHIVNTWVSGANYNASVYFNVGAGPATITFNNGATPLGSFCVTVNATPPPTPNTTFNINYNCGGTVVDRTGSPPYNSNYDWWWQTAEDGESTEFGYGTTITRTTSGNLWLRARLKHPPYAWSASSQEVGNITVYSSPPAVPSIANHGSRFSTGPLTISVETVLNALSYVWYTQNTGGIPINGQTTNSYPISNLPSTTTYYVASKNGCESSGRLAVTGTILPLPIILATGTNDNSLTMGQSVTLATSLAYTTYSWKNSANTEVSTSPTFTTSVADNYTVTVTLVGVTGDGTSTAFPVVNGLTGHNMNYLLTNTIQDNNITDPNSIASLTVDDNNQTIQYFDGLGRPIQTVSTQGSPLKKDFVQPVVYDAFGREHRKYLPVVPNATNGWYKNGIIDVSGNYAGVALDFYNNQLDNIADDPKPFAETIFEQSPLNRVLKQGAPGFAWQPDENHSYTSTDHTIKQAYEFNASNEVLLWTYTPPNENYPFGKVNSGPPSAPEYYQANQLHKNKTKDEHQNEVIEFKDKQNRTVLKKVQAEPSQYASTYYVYDDHGQLICVIPPEAANRLDTEYFGSSDAAKDTFLRRWAFRYRYDHRRRMILKHVPGSDSVRMVYDLRDRLVMTQDGNQRPLNQWLFTKYDALNRSIITGFYTHETDITQAQMSTLISTTNFCETYNGASATHGYTNTIFPNTNISVFTVTYYDNYDFKNMVSGLNYVNNNLSVTNATGSYTQPSASFLRVLGQVTGTKVNILGTSGYLYSAIYYDDKYRVIQTISQNHKSGTDRVSNLYDFTGKILQTRRTYVVNGVTRYVRETFTYDHAGRLLTVTHNTNGAGNITLVKNDYNELGELVDKQLHSTNGTTFKQSVDHRYNIRGWLTKINEPDVSTLASGETLEDYFGMELAYNNTLPGVSSNPVFNGNISAVKWSTGVVGAANKQGYHYNYDALNRLFTSGHYKEKIVLGTGWVWQDDNSNLETGFSYDLNGNIEALQRRGANASEMDNLTYNYTGNQLNYVNDSWDATTGFVNGNTGTDDYLYDVNGNMTVDKNKGITAITYNHLNLPVQVNKGATDYIVYTYDATGRKLTQQVFGSTPKVTDYIGELLFEGTTPVLKQISHSEGRVLPDGSNWEYQYHLKDHLGNVRVTFTAKTQTAATSTANFEAATNSNFTNYFRTSFDLVDHTDAGTTYTHVQHLNGGVNGRVGIGKSISVLPGDKVSIGAWAKYMNLGTTSNTTSFITALATAFGTSSIATGELGKLYSGLNSYATAVPNGNHPDDDETAPKAFVTILLFDKDYNLVDAAWKQITTVGLQSSPTVKQPPHDYLFKEVTVREPGFAYVFVSNEHPTYVDLYFDDVTVTHTPSPIVSSSDYFAFGLQHTTGERAGVYEQRKLYNGKELQDELNVGWLDYGARMYMPEIGRWGVVDPLSEGMRRWSPYNYCFNNPIRFIDPDGMAPLTDIFNLNGKKVGTDGVNNGVKLISLDKKTTKEIKNSNANQIKEGLANNKYSGLVNAPSNEVIQRSDQAYAGQKADGNERGFAVATDGTPSGLQVGDHGSIETLGKAYDELVAAGKTTAFDVHTHDDDVVINMDGSFDATSAEPSGEPGVRSGEGDYGVRIIREGHGQVTQPSWVLGYTTKVTNTTSQIGGQTTTSISQNKTVTFYTGAGPVGNVDWAKFKKAVKRINNR